ncbi:uncharacterized protein LOC111617977 [Centruroides sculpturatus]|uniref:uncharacterized protein LOC111617977 n=1 Tax=Centruroides sculpturatus TaxID=218467 RepID=UPI000C6EF03D|nr:uncharacterized protein LOC111617977 [Centruroides sculpturatus]
MPQVALLVPLHPPHNCPICLPIPREYIDHAGLVRHLRREHATELSFECRVCGLIMSKLKAMKAHQQKDGACRASIEASTPPAPIPENRRIRRFYTRPRHRRDRQATTTPPANDDPSPQSTNGSPPSEDDWTPVTRRRRSNRRRSNGAQQHRATRPAPTSSPISAGPPVALDPIPPPSGTPPPVAHHTASPPPHTPKLTTHNSQYTIAQSPRLQHPPPTLQVPQTIDSPILLGTRPSPRTDPSMEHPQPPSQSSSAVPSWALAWRDRFDVALDPDMLEVMVDDFVALAQQICDVRVFEPSNNNRHQPVSATDPSRIQRLYRINRKRAMTIITEGQPTYCNIDRDQLFQHFRSVYAASSQQQGPRPSSFPTALHHDFNDPLSAPFTPSEIQTRFKRCHNTAPGPDGLRYHHWSRIDPHGVMLCSLFNAVQRTCHTPRWWRCSNTILLYKDGDKQDVNNWRPIALSCTLGKIYSACLASRLLSWCLDNHIFSNSQKGFLPYEGCLEHNFLLQATIKDARHRRSECHIAWLDIANAFGSVPHHTIFQCLEWCGLSEDSITCICNLLANCSTRVRASDGYTDDIPILSGVKQGCPLSPLIFNIVIETAIRHVRSLKEGYSLMGEEVGIIAYADDLALVSATREGLQRQLDAITEWADWAGLRFKPRKCATLSIIGARHTSDNNTTFSLQGSHLPSLRPDETYRHLGVPTNPTDSSIFQKITDDITRLDHSKLAPWQKIDATNTILLPRLSFHLLVGSNPKKPLHKLDRHIVKHAKKWLNLPQRASSEIVNIEHDYGGANIPSCYTLAAISQVTQAMHLFTSKDPTICSLALNFLKEVVKKRIYRDPSLEDVCTYLNGSMNDEFGAKSYDISSIWTRLRIATRRLRKTINCEWTPVGDTIAIACDGNLVSRSSCTKILSMKFKAAQLTRLLRKPDQGKAYRCIAKHPASNHFLRSGNYTTFADWRFVHRARLSVVPLHGLRRFGNASKKCRRCSHPQETLAHVLNHCTRNLHIATKRHDAVLGRLQRAIRPDNLQTYVNQQVPGFDSRCRPDLVVVCEDAKTATIVDVSIPFENGQEAFSTARQSKVEKYRSLTDHFRSLGYDTVCDAFILGSLGGYDINNTSIIQRLGISRKYSSTMIKLMVSDTIRWSREIYHHHLQTFR